MPVQGVGGICVPSVLVSVGAKLWLGCCLPLSTLCVGSSWLYVRGKKSRKLGKRLTAKGKILSKSSLRRALPLLTVGCWGGYGRRVLVAPGDPSPAVRAFLPASARAAQVAAGEEKGVVSALTGDDTYLAVASLSISKPC